MCEVALQRRVNQAGPEPRRATAKPRFKSPVPVVGTGDARTSLAARAKAGRTRARAADAPPKVMVFHWNGDLYGASRSLLRFTSRLAKEGGRPVVVLGQKGPLAAALRSNGVEVLHTRWMAAMERSSLGSLHGVAAVMVRAVVSVPVFVRLIARGKPDVVHTNTSVVLTPGLAAWLTRRPHVWHIREMYADYPWMWRVYRRFVSLVSRRIVCISECVANQFPAPVKRSQVDVVYNGIPRGEMGAPDPARVRELKTALGLDGMRTVGVVGRINLPRKGQDLLVRAASLLADRHPGVRFLIVGSPYPGKEVEEQRLRHLVQELGLEDRIVFTGELDDLPLIYALLDTVVVPSPVPEPFGNTAPEAMAYGIPVVGSDRGGTAEIIDHGRTGLLFPSGDWASLAGCLDLLLDDPIGMRALGLAGQQAFGERFEFETCYSRMRRVLTDASERRPRGQTA